MAVPPRGADVMLPRRVPVHLYHPQPAGQAGERGHPARSSPSDEPSLPLPLARARAVGPHAVRVRRSAGRGRRARAGRDVCVCTERVAVASSPSPSEGCIRSVGGVEVLILESRSWTV